MEKDTTRARLTPAASLAALGTLVQQRNMFGPVHDMVAIAQKTVQHAPTDKLYDALIAILAGAHGLVEINTRVRADPALQRAFGRTACAEQSVVQDTLDACSASNITEMEQALTVIYRTHSQGYQHNYAATWQVLDVDMSGLPCGPKAACATKGYFAKQRNRRGRQLGRVLATTYQEIVVDQLFAGTTQLTVALQPLMQAAEAVLDLNDQRRPRTLVRVDAGGGSLDDVNWLLERGYLVLAKDYSAARSGRLCMSVARWYADPKVAGREIGLVVEPPTAYCRAVVRVAVRCPKAKGGFSYAVLIGPPDVVGIWTLAGGSGAAPTETGAQLLAYVHAYDRRGGGVECALKDDKQGLGLGKRGKKRFAAQQMVTLLGMLAHNILIWTRRWLAPQHARLARYGIKRLVRDILHITGWVVFDQQGHIIRIILNQAAPLAQVFADALRPLLAPAQIAITLGET